MNIDELKKVREALELFKAGGVIPADMQNVYLTYEQYNKLCVATSTLDKLIAESDWRDIESAPRDGTEILTYTPTSNDVDDYNQLSGFQVCSLSSDVNIYRSGVNYRTAWLVCYADSSGGEYNPAEVYCRPTHYMPLPQPPKARES